MIIVLFWVEGTIMAENVFPYDVDDKISMEEMKIRGKIDKPNIMYIIPRSKLQIEMTIDDNYFLSSLSKSSKPPSSINDELSAFEKSLFAGISESLSHCNTKEIKNGSCISCHYSEMTLPKNHTKQIFIKELNELCLNCHPSNYYHICWKEIEKMIFDFNEQSIPPIVKVTYPQDIFFTTIVCKKCHPAWIKSKQNSPPGLKTMVEDKEYDTDKFCKICHRSKVY